MLKVLPLIKVRLGKEGNLLMMANWGERLNFEAGEFKGVLL